MIGQVSVDQLAYATILAFAIGSILLMVLSFLPASRNAARKLWVLLGSEAVILSAGIVPWVLPAQFTLLCIVLAAGRIGHESGVVYGMICRRRLSLACATAAVLGSIAAWFSTGELLAWLLAALLGAALLTIRLSEKQSLPWTLANFIVFPLTPVVAVSHAAAQPQLAPVLLLAFLLVEVFDSFSLLGGRLYGRTPMVPRLSPNKTWEGFIAGVLALIATILALVIAFELPIWPMLLGGTVVIAAAVTGDLLGSLQKRRAGVKDYPAVLKVQGGLLDIMDSWIVAGPCLALVALLLT